MPALVPIKGWLVGFYVADLVIIADILEELKTRLHAWKCHMESTCLRINMGKTKVMSKGWNILKDWQVPLWHMQVRGWKQLNLL